MSKDDPTKPAEGETATDKEAALASAQAIADAFKTALAEDRAARGAPQPIVVQATPPPPPPTDPAHEWQQLAGEIDELAAAGRTSEAIAKTLQWAAKQGQTQNVDPTKTPAYKHMVESTKRDVRADSPEIFKRWGGEVEAIVNRMSPEERLQHDAWERAVREVRAGHFDELMAEAASAERMKIEEEYKGKLATLAPGSRGASSNTSGLDPFEEAVVSNLMLDPEKYKASQKIVEQHRVGNDINECPLLDEKLPERSVGRGSVIPPGRF